MCNMLIYLYNNIKILLYIKMVNIAIVDTNIRNYEQLISYIEQNTIIETIPDNSNGIDIMINTVKKYNNINSLHILSHGFSGIAILGNSKLTEESISDYSYLNEIHTHFAQNGEILMYGCNLAAYDKGYNFINKLADVTKLTVTASMNIVGHKSLRGSWDLNYSTGNTNRSVIISEEGQNVWHDRLTHYRGGHYYWSCDGTNSVTITIISYWRYDAHEDELPVLFTPDFNYNAQGNYSITNNGGNVQGAISKQENITSGLNDQYDINTQTFDILYTSADTFTVHMSAGNRISTLQNNAADDPFGFEFNVTSGAVYTSAQSTLTPLLYVPINKSDWTYNLTVNDNSNTLSYDLPAINGINGLNGIYGAWTQIAGLQISENGQLSLENTNNFTIGDEYSVVIEITDTPNNYVIALDFIIKFTEFSNIPIISTSNLEECVYAGLSYNYDLSASTESNTLNLTWQNSSDTIPNNLTISGTTNPLTVTFNPSYDQIGETYITSYTVQNGDTGDTATVTITFTVKKADIDDLITIVNCAIKDVQVECDKLTAVEQIICMREKEVEIYKDAQKRLEDNKNKYGKK